MLKKTITYEDFNGVERKEDFYFNLSKAEIMEMQFGTVGGLDVMLKKIANALHFDTQTAELFYDLAAMCKQNDDGKNLYLPTDVSEYIQKTESAKSAIRQANKLGYGNEFWIEILKQLENK